MADRTIWKYSLTDAIADGGATTDHPVIEMPAGAQVLSVQVQHIQESGIGPGGMLYAINDDVTCVWALVDPAAPPEPRVFVVVGTGNPVPDDVGRYVGTWQSGPFVFHLFEQDARQEGGYRVRRAPGGAVVREHAIEEGAP